MNKRTNIDGSRRSFLRAAASTLPAIAAASALPVATVQAEPATAPIDEKSKGYRLTQHINDYYKSATA